jgi:hypothetical protein
MTASELEADGIGRDESGDLRPHESAPLLRRNKSCRETFANATSRVERFFIRHGRFPFPRPLDALNFLSAHVRNLFGPFINVFLVAGQQWSQTVVGLVSSGAGLSASRFRLEGALAE